MKIELIKTWLKNNKRSQAWLAEQVGVHLVSVNSWLNGRAEISPPCQKLIALLMEADAPAHTSDGTHTPLSDEELTTAAESIQRTPEGLIHGVLLLDAQARAQALCAPTQSPKE